MIIDSSAILAIVFQEPEAYRFPMAIERASICRMSALNLLETLMVVESRSGVSAARDVEGTLRELNVEVLAFDSEQMSAAREAWRRFGKGRHPAGLNLGDCCAYAAAVTMGDELLYKGSDFPKSDVRSAAW